jgi:hypothetical protein
MATLKKLPRQSIDNEFLSSKKRQRSVGVKANPHSAAPAISVSSGRIRESPQENKMGLRGDGEA